MTTHTYPAVAAELQPLIDAIAAALRGRRLSGRDLSLTLPAPEGKTFVVSVRPVNTRVARRPAGPRRGLTARQLRLVNETIHEKIDEPISVSLLSSVAGLSRSYFSNAFRSSVGRTPHAHVVRLRIERAITLMSEADLPLSEVALATGFSDQAHFSKKFRDTVGMTPTQWRRQQIIY